MSGWKPAGLRSDLRILLNGGISAVYRLNNGGSISHSLAGFTTCPAVRFHPSHRVDCKRLTLVS